MAGRIIPGGTCLEPLFQKAPMLMQEVLKPAGVAAGTSGLGSLTIHLRGEGPRRSEEEACVVLCSGWALTVRKGKGSAALLVDGEKESEGKRLAIRQKWGEVCSAELTLGRWAGGSSG